ncbi:Bro-N domain-containing protein [Snodgrassella communis]|uniref:BRO-N domain-containing protein n=1 Tax=Snodgrassella communis TaxID=2946699 RepID=UPI001EF51AA5|nr:Bro-N domain-containing protein [Snodgrassella communis]WMY91864.1 Bro-N domain-containing protein [Snodgrassella communis]
MQNLSIFNYNQSSVRTFLDKNNELWFLINDVCAILDYKNPHRALNLHCKPKGITKRYTPTKGGKQEMVYINEPNLYRLIIKCQKPEAEPFETWVMEEVLPSIRKTGSYSLTLTTEQQYQIKEAVHANAAKTHRRFFAVYKSLYAKFNVPRYQDILAKDFDDAMLFLEASDKQPALPNLDQNGRWLVIVKNNTVTHVENINGYNCINADVFKKLRMQTKQQAEYLLELAKRMRVIDGECSNSRLDVSIEELHPKFII